MDTLTKFTSDVDEKVASSPASAAPQRTARPPAGEFDAAYARRVGVPRGRGLHGQLVQQLGQMIVSGDLGADRPLVPEEIGQRFEVSRTVVRESLRVLEAKGLVSARPNVGTRVRPVHDWNLLDPDVIEWRAVGPYRMDQCRELIELRQSFEPLAAQLAAGATADDVRDRLTELAAVLREAAAVGDTAAYVRADDEFHLLILRSSGNRMLEHLAGVVYGALEIAGLRERTCAAPSADAAGAHAEIVRALTVGDGSAAAGAFAAVLSGAQEAEFVFPVQRES